MLPLGNKAEISIDAVEFVYNGMPETQGWCVMLDSVTKMVSNRPFAFELFRATINRSLNSHQRGCFESLEKETIATDKHTYNKELHFPEVATIAGEERFQG